ncbi:MAG TPA: phosphoribosylglycinamide formyltransferase [Chitinophagales bacterium]|nr:phosphoribosylglycinamide formyltransferase [Chitinophagales bacterium]
MKHLAIFASGAGTNAKNIIQYFRHKPDIKIECIVCNNPKAGVLQVANEANIPYYLISKKDLYESDRVLDLLKSSNIDLIVLAGFLWMIPEKILSAFPDRIINIHPALLPAYGGAGMYGLHVHAAVVAAKEKETGITIHYLNEKFDEGEIIFRKSIPVEEDDTAETIAQRVQQLEYEWYPKIIELLLAS